ncbi:unnamed protein product, partial [Adineta ricciae]
MHFSLHNEEILTLNAENEYDERLLMKIYWDYRHSYNPVARLSAEIEIEIMEMAKSEEPYQALVERDSTVGNQKLIQLVNDMYHSGDVYLKDVSELTCFPLNQWLTDDYSLNTVWIGLLKLAESIKTANVSDDIERFTILLKFLYYISSKRGIRKIYLEILYTVLHDPTLSLDSITFPTFTQYTNIQHMTVVMNSIDFHSQHS